MPACVVEFLSDVRSEHPDKIALAKDADIALPVIHAVYLRTSRLFMGACLCGCFFIVSLIDDWAIP
jgi:hypothetical protein